MNRQTAKKLAALATELTAVGENDYNQNRICGLPEYKEWLKLHRGANDHYPTCAAGHAIRARLVSPRGRIPKAGLHMKVGRSLGLNDENEINYLFGTIVDVDIAATRLGFRVPKTFTAKTAIQRIERLMNHHGYDLEWT